MVKKEGKKKKKESPRKTEEPQVAVEVEEKVIEPEIVRGLVWSELSEEHILHLQALADPIERISKLTKLLNIEWKSLSLKTDETVRTEALVDLLFGALNFGLENQLSPDKVSAFISIIKKVIEDSFLNPDEADIDLDASYQIFKDFMLQHSVDDPPNSFDVFTVEDIQKLLDFIKMSLYKHYYTFRYIFRNARETKSRNLEVAVEVPQLAPKLAAFEEKELEATDKRKYLDEEVVIPEHLASIVQSKVDEALRNLEQTLQANQQEREHKLKQLQKSKSK